MSHFAVYFWSLEFGFGGTNETFRCYVRGFLNPVQTRGSFYNCPVCRKARSFMGWRTRAQTPMTLTGFEPAIAGRPAIRQHFHKVCCSLFTWHQLCSSSKISFVLTWLHQSFFFTRMTCRFLISSACMLVTKCVIMGIFIDSASRFRDYVLSSEKRIRKWGRDGVVGRAARYGLEGPGIESQWGRGDIFRILPDRPWGPPSLLYDWYGRGVALTTLPI